MSSVVESELSNENEALVSYYPTYHTNNCTLMDTECSMISTMHIPALYTPPVAHVIPIVFSQIIAPVCPHVSAIIASGHFATNAIIVDSTSVYGENRCENETSFKIEELIDDQIESGVDETVKLKSIQEPIVNESREIQCKDPLQFYFSLPKELFPTARMFDIDPNPIIDEFCKISNATENAHWILDLEFGVPRKAVTRAIAAYDVKFNSIHCKNSEAIHPGFEKCGPDFKRVLLFYYDCIVSTWYKGYIIMNQDKSVENFQTWLLLPMQILGMAWR